MMSHRLAILAVSSLLLFSSGSPAATPQGGPAARAAAENLILARLDSGHPARAMSFPVKPVAESCKDKCEDDRDKCFNGCPSDPSEGAACRNGCSDTYDACTKGC